MFYVAAKIITRARHVLIWILTRGKKNWEWSGISTESSGPPPPLCAFPSHACPEHHQLLGHQTSYPQFSSVQFSRSVVSDSLRPHGLQHTRLPCRSPSPGACLNSCPSSQWCHPSHPLSSPSPPAFNLSQHQGFFFPKESVLRISWPKYWSFSFSISPSSEHSGLISFRITGFISSYSKGLSRVFSNTIIQKHQFFSI